MVLKKRGKVKKVNPAPGVALIVVIFAALIYIINSPGFDPVPEVYQADPFDADFVPQSPLTLSADTVDIEEGTAAVVPVVLANMESVPISYRLKTTFDFAGISCMVAETQAPMSDAIVLQPGSSEELTVIIYDDEQHAPDGSYTCGVSLERDGVSLAMRQIEVYKR